MNTNKHVTFNDLNYHSQLAFLKDSPSLEIIEQASMSQYADVRDAVARLPVTPFNILVKMLKYTTSLELAENIFEHPNFDKTSPVIKELSKSDYYYVRQLIATSDETPSELLDEMLELETDEDVITSIINNPNFSNKCHQKDIFNILMNLEDRKTDYVEAFLEIKNFLK